MQQACSIINHLVIVRIVMILYAELSDMNLYTCFGFTCRANIKIVCALTNSTIHTIWRILFK